MADKLIITSALTGAITVPTQTPYLPFTPEHLIADAIACGKAGAAAVHVHARDPVNGRPLSDPNLFEPVLRRDQGRQQCRNRRHYRWGHGDVAAGPAAGHSALPP